ncbi:MAG: hypothetical protein JWM85_2739 [Acidimicrobiaceae bacterium]|nr:hypothetical protein [Acidimicrobiaceae bacterium]
MRIPALDTVVGVQLPQARGPLTERLFSHLRRPPHRFWWEPKPASASEDDLQLALYCCYELHYGGLPGVDPDWEWAPSLLEVRAALERYMEADLRARVGPINADPNTVVDDLWTYATSGGGPSLSGWVADYATLEHVRELAKHRSAYQLKEADPHTWAIPRLTGDAKAVLVAIQADEYGNGVASEMHSSLFADTMDCLGLQTQPNAYLDEIPGFTLATVNLISLLGLKRRLRAALVGHLALFEMTSTGPMGRYARGLERLGVPARGRRFYDVHVEADELHQYLASEGMVAHLVRMDPHLAADVRFGALALSAVESHFTEEVLGRWLAGGTSLRPSEELGLRAP